MAAQYGYIRVSGADQNEARQVIAMREAGLDGNHIYRKNASIWTSNRARTLSVQRTSGW